MAEMYGARQFERRLATLFQELHGEGSLARVTFNLIDGTEIEFSRGERWIVQAHEYGIEIRRQQKGVIILFASITSVNLAYGSAAGGGGTAVA